MLTRFFARRYLFSPKSRSVINVIAGVSVLSFAMPVAAMIVLLSVLNGFGDFAKSHVFGLRCRSDRCPP